MTGRQRSVERRVVALVREQLAGRSQAALARKVGIGEDRIQRLLRKSSPARMSLDELVRLCDGLGISVGDLAKALWPDRALTDLYAEVQRLRSQNRSLWQLVGPAACTRSASQRLVDALLHSGRWACRIHPLIQGPAGVSIHTNDLIVATPVDPGLRKAGYEQIRSQLLADVGALPADVEFNNPWLFPRHHSTSDRSQLPLPMPDEQSLRLSVRLYAADRAPGPDPVPLPRLPTHSILVVALRGTARGRWISTTLARALDWSHISTGSVFADLLSRDTPNPRHLTRRRNIYSNMVLREILAAPKQQSVTYHQGTPVVGDDGSDIDEHALLAADLSGLPYVVLLSESDRSLKYSVATPVNQRGDGSRFSFGQLASWRDRLRDHVDGLSRHGRGLVLDVDLPWPDQSGAETWQNREARWHQTSQLARQALAYVTAAGGVHGPIAVRDDDARALLGVS